MATSSPLSHLPETNLAPSPIANNDRILTFAFFCFFLLQLAHHQLWRDELNAWGVTVASPTLSDLVHNVHYEGHPLLWYLVLWIPARLTANPLALKFVQILVGFGIYWLIGLKSPFSLTEKILIFLSYYVLFEYTVVTRMYGICLLCLLVYLFRRSRYPERYVGNLAWLGLLAFTDIVGLMLSLALLVEYGWTQRTVWRKRREAHHTVQIGMALVLYLLFVGLTIWSGLPSSDVSRTSSNPLGFYALNLTHLAVSITNAILVPWLPIQHGFFHYYWGEIDVQLQLFVLIPFVLVAYFWLFRKEVNLLLLMGVTIVESILFSHLIYDGRVRHLGISFLAFLAALWLQRLRRPAIPPVGQLLLALSALSGITIAILLWTRPFSNTVATAHWLQAHHRQNATLVGTPDFTVASIAEQLQRPIYFLDCNCSDTYLQFSHRRDAFRWEQIPDRLLIAQKHLQTSEMIFLCAVRLSPEEERRITQRGMHVTKLAEMTGAGVPFEDYYVYKIT